MHSAMDGQGYVDDAVDALGSGSVYVSAEVAEISPDVLAALRERLPGIEIELVPHMEFKKRTHEARAFVRSGEFTPYANVILHAGVAY